MTTTEAQHPQHLPGYRPSAEWTAEDWRNAGLYATCERCMMPRRLVTTSSDEVWWRSDLLCSNTECPESKAPAP